MPRFLVNLLALALSLSSLAQSKNTQAKDSSEDWAAALVKWDTDCQPKGCILETDILRGNSDDPADPKDSREYISIYVAVDRATRQPAYFAFHVDPRAQQNNGIFIGLTKTVGQGNSSKVDLDQEGTSRLMFDKCDAQSCVVRVPNGTVEEGNDSHRMDLLQKFLSSDHLVILYLRGGKAYRTIIILSSFRKAYERLLANELPSKDK